MTAFVTAADVRGYLELNSVASASKYTDGAISSNIRAASEFIERRTLRQFADVTATKLFTTQGRTSLTIPGLRTASAINLQGAGLIADTTYWLLPDSQQSGVFTGIQFRGFSTRYQANGYLGNPEWFDRDLDLLWRKGWNLYSLPNDLSIAGTWGYTDSTLPEAVRHATKVLAAWYTKRPDSILANVALTPEGSVLSYSDIPPEVADFIEGWRLSSDQVVTVG